MTWQIKLKSTQMKKQKVSTIFSLQDHSGISSCRDHQRSACKKKYSALVPVSLYKKVWRQKIMNAHVIIFPIQDSLVTHNLLPQICPRATVLSTAVKRLSQWYQWAPQSSNNSSAKLRMPRIQELGHGDIDQLHNSFNTTSSLSIQPTETCQSWAVCSR